jgi:hypothetical protein
VSTGNRRSAIESVVRRAIDQLPRAVGNEVDRIVRRMSVKIDFEHGQGVAGSEKSARALGRLNAAPSCADTASRARWPAGCPNRRDHAWCNKSAKNGSSTIRGRLRSKRAVSRGDLRERETVSDGEWKNCSSFPHESRFRLPQFVAPKRQEKGNASKRDGWVSEAERLVIGCDLRSSGSVAWR